VEVRVSAESWWNDDEFQDGLVSLVVSDQVTLRSVSNLLFPDDFKPVLGSRNGRARWIVAERALEHFKRHREPLGKLLRADCLEHAQKIGLGSDRLEEIKRYLEHLKTFRAPAPDALVEKVVRFKGERLKAQALQEMVELQAAGELTDEKWAEISRTALAAGKPERKLVDYFSTLEDRLHRRRLSAFGPQIPWTFIDPLDALVKCIGPKQTGLILAPYKRGKSLMLLWLAVAYALQRLNVLFVTLEDPQNVVEDRLDSIVTNVPSKSLRDKPKTVTRRFNKFRAMVRANLEIYDGTDGGVSISKIEQVLLEKREEGKFFQALIIDYDHKLVPERRRKESREEIDDTYVAFQQLTSRLNLISWTAAQTQRNTRHLKILSGDRVAEDINKVRNVSLALGLGKGEWTDDSIYVWVAAHKTDRMDVGCEVVPDLERQLIYDRDATRNACGSQEESEG
jgi:hypothetical protein